MTPIESLPNELLCKILEIAINTIPFDCDPHRVRKHELATVCRRWRDTVLNSPAFWSSIRLVPKWRIAWVKIHVERSRQCPLDLVLSCLACTEGARSDFTALLNIMTPTMHRWRSITILPGDNLFILEQLDYTVFPMLERFSIPTLPPTHEYRQSRLGDVYRIPYYPKLLYPENTPRLRSLEICESEFLSPYDFRLSPTLQKVSLFLGFDSDKDMKRIRWLNSLWMQSLKALSLQGCTSHWTIEPNSVHLPCLTYLSLGVSDGRVLLRAFIVPNLVRVDYYQPLGETVLYTFNTIQSKWASVRELRFQIIRLLIHRCRVGLMALCLAAPGVRDLEIIEADLSDFLDSEDGVCPMDQLEYLEKFTIVADVDKLGDMQERLLPWLKKRSDFGKSTLKVTFSFTNPCNVELEQDILEEIGKYCDVGFLMEKKLL